MMPPNRKNIIIGGNFRAKVLKEMGIKDVPVVYITVSDLKKESEIIIRLNKNVGEFDLDLLKDFDEAFLADIGFDSQSLDNIFAVDPTPEQFNIKKELEELNIMEVKIQKGDIYELDGSRLFFFQAEDGIRDWSVTGVQTCALPI